MCTRCVFSIAACVRLCALESIFMSYRAHQFANRIILLFILSINSNAVVLIFHRKIFGNLHQFNNYCIIYLDSDNHSRWILNWTGTFPNVHLRNSRWRLLLSAAFFVFTQNIFHIFSYQYVLRVYGTCNNWINFLAQFDFQSPISNLILVAY